MTKLLIIESPGKVKKLRQILGESWRVEPSMGHVRDLPRDGMHVGPAPAFVPEYEVIAKKQEGLAKLAALAPRMEVWLGTDPDREGEAIAWHVAQCLKLCQPKRVRFGEITERAVKAAVAAPGEIDRKLVDAQEARRVLDRLIGYSASSLARQRLGDVSAGRVQTPALRLVVEREREIATFKPATYYVVRLHGEGGEGPWWLELVGDGTDKDGRLTVRATAERLATLESVAVRLCKDEVKEESPRPALTTSALQQAASVKLGFAPEKTMELAQALYETGHISYHRTDNPNLGDGAFAAIAAVTAARGLAMAQAERRFDAPDGAQAGHPAIAPTHWDVEVAGESGEERALYRLIWLRAVASQLAPATYRQRRIEAAGLDLGKKVVLFGATRRALREPGWRALDQADDEEPSDDEEAGEPNLLPQVKEGEWLQVSRGEVLEKITKAPPRYTEASLIRKLEREGVGRPSTYAAIMKRLRKGGYVELKKRRLFATVLGCKLIDLLAGRFKFADVGFTRQAERLLDEVAEGKRSYESAVALAFGDFEQELAAVAREAPKCGRCGGPLRLIQARRNGVRDFWACSSDRSKCDTTYPDIDGLPALESPRFAAKAKCPKCGKPLMLRKGESNRGTAYEFFGCVGFRNGCDAKFVVKDGEADLAQPFSFDKVGKENGS